ncbi:MAG: glycosyltransferase [Candidatus Helarchaeota archaeon]
MQKIKVTIGVCVRNSAVTLHEAIESISCQDYPHELMEVIFVDDGSKDTTLSIINSYVSKMDTSVKVFHHEWKGLGPSRNVVVDNASGDYIIWVDGDMVLPKDHVRKQVEFMEQKPKVGIAKARYGFMRGENIVASLENIPFIVFDSKNGSLYSKLPGTGGAIFRVEAIRQVNGFDDRLKGVGEDQDVAYRIKVAGWRIERSHALFFERRVQSWKRLWQKYFWYGHGDYTLYLKNRKIFSIYRMIPLAGFVAGASLIFYAYRLTKCKTVFLLPFHFAFKMAAWCAGFTKSKIEFSRI